MRALDRELRASIALGADTLALSDITASNAFEGNSTNSWSVMLHDLEELLRNVRLGSVSRPFFVLTPANAKGIAKAGWADGVTAFGALGGDLLGIPAIVSDGQGAGKISLIDASGVAIASEPIEMRSSEQATLELSDTPSGNSATPTATSSVSMWQTNNRCLLAEKRFALKVVRPNAAATLTNVQWGKSFL